MELHKIYPPFKRTEEYMEFEPCDVLKPYIRCFWGSRNVVMQEES